MASSNITLNVRGVDKTGAAFASVRKRAASVGKAAAVAVAAAVAATGAAVYKAVADLGKLSDEAQRAGASAKDIQGLANAMGMVGIKGASVEMAANAFQKMALKTGRSGTEGFRQTILEIAKLPTVAERSKAAMEAFGRSGLAFMPAIEESVKSGRVALLDLAEAMPAASDQMAESGDRIKDALDNVWNGIKVGWQSVVVDILGSIGEDLEGGIRGASLNMANDIQWAMEAAVKYVKWFVNNAQNFFGAWGNFARNIWENINTAAYNAFASIGNLFSGSPVAKKEYKDVISELVQDMMPDVDIMAEPAQRYVEKAAKIATAIRTGALDAAKSVAGDGIALPGEEKAEKAAKTPRATGTTTPAGILGGTYAAITAGLRQTVRQNDVLTATRKNGTFLARIADAMDALNGNFDNMEVI